MGHHIVACEEFYVDNNIVIYLERKKTVPAPDFLQHGFMLHHTTPHKKCIDIDQTLKMQPLKFQVVTKYLNCCFAKSSQKIYQILGKNWGIRKLLIHFFSISTM